MSAAPLLDVVELRRRIRKDLPKEAFENVPSKALLFIPLNLLFLAAAYIAHRYDMEWYWLVAISLVLGQVFATIAFLAHDVMHGTVVKSRKLMIFIAHFGLYPFLVSPHLWRVWHVAAHHGRTNTSRDPDAIVNLDEYRAVPFARLWTKLIPCSRNPISGLIFFSYWFTAHGQHVLWFNRLYKDWDLDSYGFNRTRAIVDTVIYVLFWAAIAVWLGPYKSLFIVFIPMIVGNAILLLFIANEHTYLPRSETGKTEHPLVNTVSVRVPPIIDKLNLNFSNHVEHHLFPSMNYKYTPLVRDWLRRNMADYYLEPTLGQSLRILFGTPRVYADAHHLCYPADVECTKVDTRQISKGILAGNR